MTYTPSLRTILATLPDALLCLVLDGADHQGSDEDVTVLTTRFAAYNEIDRRLAADPVLEAAFNGAIVDVEHSCTSYQGRYRYALSVADRTRTSGRA